MKYDDFEKAIERLAEIVAELEKGDSSLESSLELFEEGMRISQFCGERLSQAERKVEILLKERGRDKDVPFEVGDGS